jgi:L-threonylcarbamoyladenylate synthase
VRAGGDQALPSPGLLERHYSPRTRMVTLEGPLDAVAARLTSEARREVAAGRRVGLLVVDELGPAATGLGLVRHVGPSTSPDAMAARLYAALRDLDESGVDLILASSVADGKGLGAAIRDRLRRAAAGHVIRC